MAAESSDLSQAEKKILFLEAKQIAKMIYHFIQNVDFFFIGPGPFWMKTILILAISPAFFLSLR